MVATFSFFVALVPLWANAELDVSAIDDIHESVHMLQLETSLPPTDDASVHTQSLSGESVQSKTSVIDAEALNMASAEALSEDGYQKIKALKNKAALSMYVERVLVAEAGTQVPDKYKKEFDVFIQKLMEHPEKSYKSMKDDLVRGKAELDKEEKEMDKEEGGPEVKAQSLIRESVQSKTSVSESEALAMGSTAALSRVGFQEVQALQSTSALDVYVKRVLAQHGTQVPDKYKEDYDDFIQQLLGHPHDSYESFKAELDLFETGVIMEDEE
jgi:hypothetical protein